MNVSRWPLAVLFGIYKYLLSPALHLLAGAGMGCRFEPTCSSYAKQALETRGWLAGSWLSLKRICRCNPWSSGGLDPVPIHPVSIRGPHGP